MGTLSRDADSPQPASALNVLLMSLDLMYNYSQNYSSSLAQSQRSTQTTSGPSLPRPKQKQKSFNSNSLRIDKQPNSEKRCSREKQGTIDFKDKYRFVLWCLSCYSLSPWFIPKPRVLAARDEGGCGVGIILKLQGLNGALTHLQSTWACPVAPGPRLIPAGESDCMTGDPGCELVGAGVASGRNS